MLALRQVQSFLPWLVDWLERWTACRQVQQAALAVWDGGSADTLSARAAPGLLQSAGRHGLSLIFDDNALVEDKSSMVASDLHKREVSLTPTLQHILEQPERNYYPHWGSTSETRHRCHLEAGDLDFWVAIKAAREPRCPGFETSVSTQMKKQL